MKAIFLPIFMLCIASGCASQTETSPLWKQYKAEKEAHKPTWLPDFSYAGYHRGEKEITYSAKRFNVTAYGAVPDDDKDDLEAIAKAVKAAEANGGGIVFLPKGRYLVNTSMANRQTIRITSSNIVLKGEGSTKGGTIIHSIHPYGGGDPHKLQRLHLGQNLLKLHSEYEERPLTKKKVLCQVAGNFPRETFSLNVDSTDKLKTGQWVYLYALNNKILENMIKPYKVDEKWTTILKNKAYTVEIHQIKSIKDNNVTFFEPIRYDIRQEHGWVLKEYKPIEEVGIEDICFMGNSYHRYVHHRSGMDDSGWAFIKMKGVVNSWVRRCSFINCNQTVYVALSSNISLLNIVVDGNKGHHIPRAVFFACNVLGGLILDRAGFDHGPSLSWGSNGTVFWRCNSKGAIDCHAGRPYANLFDNITGGRLNSSGGTRDYPQHLRFLVIWNYNNTHDEVVEYDFWKKDKNNCFVMPIIAGFHGNKATFVKEKVDVLESLGKKVDPESLYEAQLELRLGEIPAWLTDARREYDSLSQAEMPDYLDKDKNLEKGLVYNETFNVDEMLKYLTSLSLQMFRSKQFAYQVDSKNLELHTDQGLVRNTLYSLMNCIYHYTKHNNKIVAQKVDVQGKAFVRFTVQSGAINKAIHDISSNIDVKHANIFAAKIGGTVNIVNTDGKLAFEVLVPNIKEKVVSLGERIDCLKARLEKEVELKQKIDPILAHADSILGKPIFKRVYSLKDFKKRDGKWAREIPVHKRTEMMKNKENALLYGLASDDTVVMRALFNELPLIAAAYRLTGDQKYLDYLSAQLKEMTTWYPFQRPGWTLRVGSKKLREDGDGVWLATGAGIQAIVMAMDILPENVLTPGLYKSIDETLKREMELIIKDYKEKRPWYVRAKKYQSNQWIVPFSGLTLAALYLGKDNYAEAYDLGKDCLAKSLSRLGTEGAVSEGFAYAIQWSVPGLLIPAYYMALKANDKEFINNQFFRKFPFWVAESYQPGKNVINAFDWWGGCRNMYDRYMLSKITMLTAFSASPYLQWILFNEHTQPEPDAFGMICYGLPEENMKQPPLFAVFKRASRVNWRSSWQGDADGVWIRGRDKNDFHAHHDTGHVNYIKNGKMVLLEASTTGYSDSRQFHDYKSFRGHNVLQVGDVLKGKNGVDANFNILKLDENGGDVKVDASTVYDNSNWQRRITWDDSKLSVFDKVKVTDHKNEKILFRWHLGTENDATLTKLNEKHYIISVKAGKIEFPAWIGSKNDYWQIPENDIVLTPEIKVEIKANVPISVNAAKYVDHTFKFRMRYHEHTTLEVVSDSDQLECTTTFIAE